MDIEQRMQELRQERLTNPAVDRMLLRDRVAYLEAQVADLRAVLAPLLDDPLEHDGDNVCDVCRFCRATDFAFYAPRYHRPPLVHAPDCPVLRKDALLGRD